MMGRDMSAFTEFIEEIKKTDVMRRVLNLLEKEPAYMLKVICKEFEASGNALPDHRLQLNGFIEDISLKAFVAAEYVSSEDGGRMSLYQYRPTDKGIQKYRYLLKTGYYDAAGTSGKPA
jgi:hypothetical protein